MDYTKELSGIEQIVNNAKLEKATLEERKRKSEEEETIILEKIKKEEITEDKLKNSIMDLEIEIEKIINKAKEILKC